MTGGSEPKFHQPKSDPAPSPAAVEEITGAKDAAKRRAQKRGRGSTVFAGALNRRVLNFGKSRVGE